MRDNVTLMEAEHGDLTSNLLVTRPALRIYRIYINISICMISVNRYTCVDKYFHRIYPNISICMI